MSGFLKFLLQLGIFFGLVVALLSYQFSQYGAGEMDPGHPDVGVVSSLLRGAEIELTDSYAVYGNLSGDIDRGFAARVSGFDWESLNREATFYRGDQLPAELAQVVQFNAEHLGGGSLSWYPAAEDTLSLRYFVAGLSLDLQEGYVDSGRIVLLRPQDQMVFYSWVKF